MTQTLSSIQLSAHEALPVPQRIRRDTHCILAYTLSQRRHFAMRSVFRPLAPPPIVVPIPGNPHAMSVTDGTSIMPDGSQVPYTTIVHVPGVLVKTDDFVMGFHYGMMDAYETSEEGEEPVSEQEVIGTFSDLAADAVMLGNEEVPTAWSAGYMFGFVRGCILIGTPAFQQWANGSTTVGL